MSHGSASDEARLKDLSVRGLLRRTSGLSVVSILTAGLAVPTTLLAARWVGPQRYGAAQFVLLAYFYAALVRTGVFDGGIREFIHETGLGNRERAHLVRSVGFSWEMVVSAVPGLLMVPMGLLLGDPLRRLGFLLAPVAVVAASLSASYGGMFIAEQRLAIVSRTWLVRALILSATVLTGVATFGPAAIFLGPIVADLIAVCLFAAARPRIHLRWALHRAEGWRLLVTGFPFGVGAVVYWLYRTVGSSTIAVSQPAAVLGVYAFALVPVTVLTRTIAMADAALMPALWTAMADPKDRAWVGQAERITVMLAVVAAVATNVAHAGYGSVVLLVVPGFAQSVPLFNVVSLSVLPIAIASVTSLVLSSVLLNRQRTALVILVLGLALNVGANAVVLALDGSPLAIAWNDVWVQWLVLAALFEAAAPSLDPTGRRFRLYAKVAVLASCMAAVDWTLHSVLEPSSGSRPDMALRLAVRTGFVIVTWAVVLGTHLAWSRRRGSAPDPVPVAVSE